MIMTKNTIHFDRIKIDTRTHNAQQIFQRLSTEAQNALGLSSKDVMHLLNEAEKESPSGIGNGVAIPHIQSESITKPFGFFLKLTKPAIFKSLDDLPVDLIAFMASPKDGLAHSLQSLSRVTRLLRDDSFRGALRATHDPAKIEQLFRNQNIETAAIAA